MNVVKHHLSVAIVFVNWQSSLDGQIKGTYKNIAFREVDAKQGFEHKETYYIFDLKFLAFEFLLKLQLVNSSRSQLTQEIINFYLLNYNDII